MWLLLLLLSRFSRVRLCVTPQRAAHQPPRSLGFSRQEHWSGLPFPSPMHESKKWKWSRSVVSDSSWLRILQPTRLLCPWDFPGKSTGVGCHCLLNINSSHKESGTRFFKAPCLGSSQNWVWIQNFIFTKWVTLDKLPEFSGRQCRPLQMWTLPDSMDCLKDCLRITGV